MATVDTTINGEDKVSNYLKQRELIRFIKSKSSTEEEFINREGKVLRAHDKLLNKYHRYLVKCPDISVDELLNITLK